MATRHIGHQCDAGHMASSLACGTWNQALASALGASPGRPVAEIAVDPGVAWLAACSLREHGTSHRRAS